MNNERFERQLILSEIGERGQELLTQARVVVVGAGGLGCPCLVYLTAAGVGHICICDGDTVGMTNLNRQFLYRECDIGKNKAQIAALRLSEMNPNAEIIAFSDYLSEKNADELLKDAEIVIDCLDSYTDRLLLNDACVRLGKTFIHAGVCGFSGQITVCVPGKTACLRCMGLTEEKIESGKGIIGAAAGVLGSMQALEAVKILSGNEYAPGIGFFDGISGELTRLPIKIQSGCVCNK